MSDLAKRRTIQQARAREKRILEGIAEIGPFLQDEDWRILGYEQLEDWVRDKLTPVLRELDASLGAEIRNPIILQIDADQQAKPPAQRLRQREIGDLTGSSQKEVSRILTRSSSESFDSTADLDTVSDQEKETVIDAEIVEDHPRDLTQAVKDWRAQFPAREESKDDIQPEYADKWLVIFSDSVHENIDAMDEWRQWSSPEGNELLKEELTIIKEKIQQLEDKL